MASPSRVCEIPGVDVPILNYFDASAIAGLDDRKRRIRLRDLLTMTAGFHWDEDTVPCGSRGARAATCWGYGGWNRSLRSIECWQRSDRQVDRAQETASA